MSLFSPEETTLASARPMAERPRRDPPASLTFETLGNATIQFAVDGVPLLVTDPWLIGTCYFGSWALDHPLSEAQIRNAQQSEFVWISHGHPDHLHHQSLDLIPRTAKMLIPDHYSSEIQEFLLGEGFAVEILRYRAWKRIHPELELLCIDNENQDAILVARFGNALILNLNDSPLCGEERFLKKLVSRHPNDRVFLLQLCAVDADMRNFVDAAGHRILPPPEQLKPGAVRAAARGARRLGAKFFCCSSSQHLYIRSDTVWANPYRISFEDMRRHWNHPGTELVPPFVTVDLLAGTCTENHPTRRSDLTQITGRTADDDWNEPLTSAEKAGVIDFFSRFQLLSRYLDFIEVVVAGETIRIDLRRGFAHRPEPRGVTFFVPRRSLLDAVAYGYFDDLLIGNFMKTRLHGGAALYPFVTPILAKLGGNAKVYDRTGYRRFRRRYFARNPLGFAKYRVDRWIEYRLAPQIRVWAARAGVFDTLKRFYRERLLKDIPLPDTAKPGGASGAPTNRIWPPALTRARKWAPARPDLSMLAAPRLIISIDTEEDFDWQAPFSASATTIDSIARQEPAQRMIEGYGAAPIYLCDFPVAARERAYRLLREWQAAGRCAIGAHLHPWVNPPRREQISSANSYPCNLPLDLQREKLHVLTETIAENIGVRPAVYKAGRYGGGLYLPALLKPLGYRVDMSINPIGNYGADGGPNQTRFPHAPFWLDPQRELLAIPATGNVLGALRNRWVAVAEAMRKDTSDRIRLGWALRRFGLINHVFLSPEGTPLEEAKALTRFLVAAGHRVFTLGYHSTSLNPGSTPYVRDAADLRHFLGWIDAYLDFFFGEIGGVPTVPEQIYTEARLAPITMTPTG